MKDITMEQYQQISSMTTVWDLAFMAVHMIVFLNTVKDTKEDATMKLSCICN